MRHAYNSITVLIANAEDSVRGRLSRVRCYLEARNGEDERFQWMTRLLYIFMSSMSYGPPTFWPSNHVPLVCILMSSMRYGPPTFWPSNHIPPSAMSRLPGLFHSEMRHHKEVEQVEHFCCSRPLRSAPSNNSPSLLLTSRLCLESHLACWA